MLGWLILANILTSFKAFSFSLSDNLTILTFFNAYSPPSSNHFTWYTELYAPSPIQITKSVIEMPKLFVLLTDMLVWILSLHVIDKFYK